MTRQPRRRSWRSCSLPETMMQVGTSKNGRAKFSKWRMTHAKSHGNVQLGKYGSPMIQHDMDDQILEPLHYAELGLPKYPWKYGILENASDDARELIANKLDKWKHPVDTRTAEDGRDARQKWFTGASWSTFCAGRKGSPGGPKAIAELMLIVAEDMQQRGVTLPHRASSTTTNAIVAAEVAPYAPPPNRVEDGGAREGGGGGASMHFLHGTPLLQPRLSRTRRTWLTRHSSQRSQNSSAYHRRCGARGRPVGHRHHPQPLRVSGNDHHQRAALLRRLFRLVLPGYVF